MIFNKKSTGLSVIALGLLFVFAATGAAAPETTLLTLQTSFVSQKKQLMYSYLQQLAALETAIVTSNSREGADEVKAEITRIKEEIKRLPEFLQPPQAIAVPEPPPQIVISKRDPVTHTNEVQGLAGAASFSKNNIYTFYLAVTGPSSTLKYWATGRRSADSEGNVWLITPAGQREKINSWRERNFTAPATEISSHEKITPFTGDISKFVTAPGTYRVEFEWTGGIDPLVIYRVELTS